MYLSSEITRDDYDDAHDLLGAPVDRHRFDQIEME